MMSFWSVGPFHKGIVYPGIHIFGGSGWPMSLRRWHCVVCIDPVGVRIPAVAATKMNVEMTPCTEGAPMVLTGREWKTSS